MDRQRAGQVLFVVLTGGLVASGAFAVKVGVDKQRLSTTVTELEQERARLSEQLATALHTIDDQASALTQLQDQLTGLQARLKQTEDEVQLLQANYLQLRQEHAGLQQELATTTHAKAVLETKLSNLHDLKAAIRTVKHEMWQRRLQAWMAHLDEQRAQDQQELARGNRGFVVRDGVSTIGALGHTKLQVRVLEPQTK